MDFIKKIPSLMDLLASIVFNDLSRVQNCLYWLDNEVWDVGSVLYQKEQKLGHSSASYAILNSHVSFLASHIYHCFK